MIRLGVLGSVHVTGDGGEGQNLPAHSRRLALLAYLSLRRPRGFVRRDALLPLFWADLDQARARKALRQAVYVLRKELVSEAVESRGGDDLRVSAEHLWCDAVAFEEALDAGRLEEALRLYRGHLLPGFHLSGAPEFIDWLERERHRLRLRAVEAARALALASAQEGGRGTAVAWARKWLALAPDDEEAVEQATRLLAQAGDRTGALTLYEDFKQRLEAEYDLTPSPALEELAQAVRDGTLAAPRPPAVSPMDGDPAAPVTLAAGAGERERDRRPGRWWAVPVAMTMVAVLAGMLWMGWVPEAIPDSSTETTVVAVFPFSVQGDPSVAYLEEGMVDLLSTSLNGAGPIRTVDPATMFVAPGVGPALSPAQGVAVARSLGAEFFVLGSVVEAAGQIRAAARLYDLEGEVRGAAEGTAQGEAQVFELVDLVARELLASRYGSPALRLTGVAARTTTSLPALKAYLAAERAFRTDRSADALAEAQRAVTLDPGFGLAHYRLSTAATWMNQPRVALQAARDAYAASEALGPRDQMLLKAHLDQQERRFEAAIDGYRAVVAEQPDHVDGWFKLGEALFHANPVLGRPIAEADAALVKALELAPGHVQAALHRARLAAIRGDGAVLDSVAAIVRGVGAQEEAELEILALQAALRPEAEGAVVDAFTSGRPARQLNAAIWSRAAFSGDLQGAERLTRVALGAVASLEWQAVFHVRLGYLALAQGRWNAGWDEFGRAEALDPGYGLEEKGLVLAMPFFRPDPGQLEEVRRKLEVWQASDPPTLLAGRAAQAGLRKHLRLYLLGLVEARAGDAAAANATADALAALPSPEWPEGLVENWVRGVRAYALHAEGRDEEARLLLADEGRGTWGFANPPSMTASPERFLWAMLEAAHGDPALARRALKTFGYRRVYHLPFVGPAALAQARLAAQVGALDEASQAYEVFLHTWAGCDQDLRLLWEEATAELAEVHAGS